MIPSAAQGGDDLGAERLDRAAATSNGVPGGARIAETNASSRPRASSSRTCGASVSTICSGRAAYRPGTNGVFPLSRLFPGVRDVELSLSPHRVRAAHVQDAVADLRPSVVGVGADPDRDEHARPVRPGDAESLPDLQHLLRPLEATVRGAPVDGGKWPSPIRAARSSAGGDPPPSQIGILCAGAGPHEHVLDS